MEGNFLSDCTMTCLIGLMWLLILLCLKMIGLKLSGKIGLLFPSFSSSFPSGMLTFYSLLTLVIFWGTYGWLWCFVMLLEKPGNTSLKGNNFLSRGIAFCLCLCTRRLVSWSWGAPSAPQTCAGGCSFLRLLTNVKSLCKWLRHSGAELPYQRAVASPSVIAVQ